MIIIMWDWFFKSQKILRIIFRKKILWIIFRGCAAKRSPRKNNSHYFFPKNNSHYFLLLKNQLHYSRGSSKIMWIIFSGWKNNANYFFWKNNSHYFRPRSRIMWDFRVHLEPLELIWPWKIGQIASSCE